MIIKLPCCILQAIDRCGILIDKLFFTGIVRLNPNVAPKGTATQSSEYTNPIYPAYLANDENFSPQTSSCAITDNTAPSWWQVDLMIVYEIAKIAITGRAEYCKR